MYKQDFQVVDFKDNKELYEWLNKEHHFIIKNFALLEHSDGSLTLVCEYDRS